MKTSVLTCSLLLVTHGRACCSHISCLYIDHPCAMIESGVIDQCFSLVGNRVNGDQEGSCSQDQRRAGKDSILTLNHSTLCWCECDCGGVGGEILLSIYVSTLHLHSTELKFISVE